MGNWQSLLSDFWLGFNQNVAKVSEHKITDVIDYVEKSLGPVPFHELVLIRIKANLPSPEYKSELYSREDIYC